MKHSLGIYVLFIIASYHINGEAQERVVHYPVRFTQYFDCSSFQNPAMACSNSSGEIYLGNQRLVGNLSKVSSYFLAANFKLAQQKNGQGPYSSLGIVLYNDREGKYLNRTRAYAVYAWHANVFRELKMSAGLRLGMMNYSVKETPRSGGGSAINPDASFGMQLYKESSYFGVSVNQLFGSEVQPLQQITYLAQYLNFTTGTEFSIAENILLRPSASLRMPFTTDGRVLYSANAVFSLYERFEVGTGIHNNDKMVLHVGIPNMNVSNGNISFTFSYAFLLFNKQSINTPAIELGTSYRIK